MEVGGLQRPLPGDSIACLDQDLDLDRDIGEGAPEPADELANRLVPTGQVAVGEMGYIARGEEATHRVEVPVDDEHLVGGADQRTG